MVDQIRLLKTSRFLLIYYSDILYLEQGRSGDFPLRVTPSPRRELSEIFIKRQVDIRGEITTKVNARISRHCLLCLEANA